jgi:para-aminobenzoate synthetase component 1
VATTTPQPTVLTRSISLKKDPGEVFAAFARLPGCFYLDSALATHELSRFSYIGAEPFLTLKSRGEVMDIVEGKKVRHQKGRALDVLQALLQRYQVSSGTTFVPFIGGAVGYIAYDFGRQTTGVNLEAPDDLGLPDLAFNFYRKLLAYDHAEKRWYAAAADFSATHGPSVRKRLTADIEKIAAIAAGEAGAVPEVDTRAPAPDTGEPAEAGEDADRIPESPVDASGPWPWRSSFTRERYLEAVGKIKERIAAGDIYQANLTQRLRARMPSGAVSLYHALREVNPAPYGCYVDLGECVLAGQSPELFLSVRGRQVETRPIKGTRPRGATPADDERLKAELLASAKDRAELVMIADLERNDLGRVCKPGSVEVTDVTRLETFPTVHHLVSVIRGELLPGRGIADILQATFPGGSITGAPKIKAMQIIDGIEPVARGPYTGAVGLIGFDGSADLNVAIRTFVVRGDEVCFGVGGGIVADSDPGAEYAESLAKARGMLEALARAAKPA